MITKRLRIHAFDRLGSTAERHPLCVVLWIGAKRRFDRGIASDRPSLPGAIDPQSQAHVEFPKLRLDCVEPVRKSLRVGLCKIAVVVHPELQGITLEVAT